MPTFRIAEEVHLRLRVPNPCKQYVEIYECSVHVSPSKAGRKGYHCRAAMGRTPNVGSGKLANVIPPYPEFSAC